jgi:hypothetical protein
MRDEETTIRGFHVLRLIGMAKVDIVAVAELVVELLRSGEMLKPFHASALEILTFSRIMVTGRGFSFDVMDF